MQKNKKNFLTRHWHWLGLALFAVLSGIVWANSINCANNGLLCYRISEKDSSYQGQPQDSRETFPITYLNDELLRITNHTGDIEDLVEFCTQSQNGVCSATHQGYTTGAGDSTLIDTNFSTVVEQGFLPIGSAPTDGKWHQMTTGLNDGDWVNLEKDGSGNYVNKKVYKTRPRKVLSPFQTATELIKLVQATQTAGNELYFEEVTQSSYACMGAAVGVCSGPSGCSVPSFDVDDCLDVGGPTYCSWDAAAPKCPNFSNQSSCDGYSGCSWTETTEGEKRGLEICVIGEQGNTDLGNGGDGSNGNACIGQYNAPSSTLSCTGGATCNGYTTQATCEDNSYCNWSYPWVMYACPGAITSTSDVQTQADCEGLSPEIGCTWVSADADTGIVGYQCSGNYTETYPSECTGAFTTSTASCEGADYETVPASCSGVVSGLPDLSSFDPPRIESGMNCREDTYIFQEGACVMAGCNWNEANGQGVCEGVVDVFEPMANPQFFWPAETLCTNIETEGSCRGVGGCAWNSAASTCDGIVAVDSRRTDFIQNGLNCNTIEKRKCADYSSGALAAQFGPFGNASSIQGCTWVQPIYSSCGDLNHVNCAAEDACDWEVESENVSCSGSTESACTGQNAACVGVGNSIFNNIFKIFS